MNKYIDKRIKNIYTYVHTYAPTYICIYITKYIILINNIISDGRGRLYSPLSLFLLQHNTCPPVSFTIEIVEQ